MRLAAAFPPGSARARINLSTPSALLPALAYTQRIQVAWINGDCKYPAFGQRHWIPKDQKPHFGKHFAYLQSWKAQVLESQYLTTLYGLQLCKIIMSFDTDYGSEWTYFCVQDYLLRAARREMTYYTTTLRFPIPAIQQTKKQIQRQWDWFQAHTQGVCLRVPSFVHPCHRDDHLKHLKTIIFLLRREERRSLDVLPKFAHAFPMWIP